MRRTTALIGAFALSAFLTAACHREPPPRHEGPMEKAGEKMDKGVNKLGEKMEEGGQKLQDKAHGD